MRTERRRSVAGHVGHAEVEVGARIDGRRAWTCSIGVVEVEVLDLGRDEERVARAPGPAQDPAQFLAGIAVEGRAVEVDDVAEHPRHRRVVVVPGQQLEGLQIRAGQHVGLLHAAEAVDGRTVEGHALVEGILQLRRRDVEPLGGPEHVGEPQLDEADAAFFHGPEHVVALALHQPSFAGAGRHPPIEAMAHYPGGVEAVPADPADPLRIPAGRALLTVARAGLGRSPAAVFLHAGIADHRSWSDVMELLGSDMEVVAYDRRGFGTTTYEPEGHDQVADLCAVVDALGLERVVLVGNSRGARSRWTPP